MKINLETGPPCDLSALTPGQRQRHEKLLRELLKGSEEIRAQQDGFSFLIPRSSERIPEIVEWIKLESLCCPFFNFNMEWKKDSEHVEVTVSGSDGAEAILAGYLDARKHD